MDVKNWPEYFFVRFYETYLIEHMVQMCKTVDVVAFEPNLENNKAVLTNNPENLEYLYEYHDNP